MMYDLYASLCSSHKLFSHWSDELSLLQVLLILRCQLVDWSSWFDSLFWWDIASCDHDCFQCHYKIREIRIFFNDELRFRLIEINILSNLMLFDQLLKLFYSQMIILWDKHYHEEIKSLFVYFDATRWFYIKLFSRVFVWDLFNCSTSDERFYSSWWIAIWISWWRLAVIVSHWFTDWCYC
jgi:hypothetical protein